MTVGIRLGNRELYGWKRARISMGMEQLSGVFELSIKPNIPAGRKWPIHLGTSCEIIADGRTVIAGYVDRIEPSYSKKTGRVMVVAGRDWTGDLTRASALPIKEWKNSRLQDICDALLLPFGRYATYYKVPNRKIPKFVVEQGETVLDAISRACSYFGVLPFPDGRGNIIIGKGGGAGTLSTVLLGPAGLNANPSNIKRARAQASDEDRHSEYILRGEPDEWLGASEQVSQEGKASDPNFKRYCPLIVTADNITETSDLSERAAHMAKIRRAKGFSYEYTLAGWSHSGGDVWRPNHLLRCDDQNLPLRDLMLISKVDLTVDKDEGSETSLGLVPPDTYSEIASPLPDDQLDGYHMTPFPIEESLSGLPPSADISVAD